MVSRQDCLLNQTAIISHEIRYIYEDKLAKVVAKFCCTSDIYVVISVWHNQAIAEIISLMMGFIDSLSGQHRKAILDPAVYPGYKCNAMVNAMLQTRTYKSWKYHATRGALY